MELTKLGRYRLCYELASGGMATVYLARMEGAQGFEKIVALKRIHPHLVSDRSYVDMFLDEARIASGITHPNVCGVFDFGEVDGEYFLAMEYLVGEPLARLCRRAAADPKQKSSPLHALKSARIIEEACEGLHAAHESKDVAGRPLQVVHRDVSPRNLFMTYGGVVQVVDFGIASARQRVHRTSTGQLKGTVPYMAPEQVRGGEVDRRVDIWALGVVLWELLTLDRLFRRDTEVESMYAVVVDDIPAPSDKRPGIPPELDAIVMKALQRDPAERWRTAREMGQALHAFAASQSSVVGAAELSEWMNELFPQGESRKREIMGLAVNRGFQVHPESDSIAPEVSGAQTALGELDASVERSALTSAERRSSESVPATAESPSKRTWVRPALVVGALLLPVIGFGGYQLSTTENPQLPSDEVIPIVVPPAPSANAEQTRAGDAVKEPNVVADAPAPVPTEAPKSDTVAKEAKPTVEEPQPIAKAKPTARKRAVRAPRTRKKSAEPVRAQPQPSGLPGQVKILTKGHAIEIYEGNKLLGKSPTTLTLPAGRHRLRLKSTESGESLTLPVNVVANAVKTISLDVK
jgi:serine/threonine-protein kinase